MLLFKLYSEMSSVLCRAHFFYDKFSSFSLVFIGVCVASLLITIGVIFLSLSSRWFCQRYLYDCGAREAAFDGCVESVHVLWKESQTDGS